MKRFNFFLLAFIISLLHFGATVLALFNGITIFKGPSTTGEIFWYDVMQVLLFPSSFIFLGVCSDFVQLIIMILNSSFWGFIIAAIIWKLRSRK